MSCRKASYPDKKPPSRPSTWPCGGGITTPAPCAPTTANPAAPGTSPNKLSSMTDEQIRLEDCRLEVLNALYARRTGAHAAATLRSVYLSRADYTLKEVETALHDLKRLGYVEDLRAGTTGAEFVWQITGEGLRFKEQRR